MHDLKWVDTFAICRPRENLCWVVRDQTLRPTTADVTSLTRWVRKNGTVTDSLVQDHDVVFHSREEAKEALALHLLIRSGDAHGIQ